MEKKISQIVILLASAVCFFSADRYERTIIADESVMAVFAGKTPCQEIARELNVNVEEDCFKLKWELTLYQDAKTQTPTSYKMEGTFYRKNIREGKWIMIRGSVPDTEAVVYQLDPDKPDGSIFLLKGDEDVLFMLDRERNLLVGNDEFSYTLNRVE
jgi:hypothetical protein